jgi:hypothetical protein
MNHLFASYHHQTLENIDDGVRFAARPLKQWRKQYQTKIGYSRAATGMPMDRPGGLVPVASPAIQCATCNGALAARVNATKDSNCTACEPIQLRVKPLLTNPVNVNDVINDTSFTSSAAYLQSRCSTYDQKMSTEPVPTAQYFSAAGLPLEPSDSPTGAQVREMTNCFTRSTCNTTIYKPNNTPFAQQGGVSSSSRLARLKYDTLNNVPVTNNGFTYKGSVFNTAAGAMGLNSGLYQTEPSPSYYTKPKPQSVKIPYKIGQKVYCPAANTICM